MLRHDLLYLTDQHLLKSVSLRLHPFFLIGFQLHCKLQLIIIKLLHQLSDFFWMDLGQRIEVVN